jgi:hypothetical protein
LPSLPVGTLVNGLTVILGSLIGIFLKNRIPPQVQRTVFQAIGLCTLLIGIQMALKVENVLLLIFSLLGGAIVGESLNLEAKLVALSEKLKKKVNSSSSTFTQGLLTAFLIFCVGSLTILGAFDEGLRQDPTLMFTKATLDGFTSIALSASYGIGVLFSVIPLLIYQLSLTFLANSLQTYFTPLLINQLTGVGGVLILGLGISLLELKKLPITNLLPSLLFVLLLKSFL